MSPRSRILLVLVVAVFVIIAVQFADFRTPCPNGFTTLNPKLTQLNPEGTRVLLVDGFMVKAVVNHDVLVQNRTPSPGHETVLQYVHEETNYKNIVRFVDGRLCFMETIVYSAPMLTQANGFLPLEVNLKTHMADYGDLSVSVEVINDTHLISVRIGEFIVVAQARTPPYSGMISLEFNIGVEKFVVIVTNTEGTFQYKLQRSIPPTGPVA